MIKNHNNSPVNRQVTLRQLSKHLDIQPASLRRRIRRNGLNHEGSLDDVVSEEIVSVLSDGFLSSSDIPIPKIKERVSRPQKTTPVKRNRVTFMMVLRVLPLPMLGLAASYGVYFFASQFVPFMVAITEACAFELTYIGLASMKNLSVKQAVYARRVSIGAVAVSVLYNTLAGAIHMNEGIITDLNIFYFWTLSLIHGAPLAILAYFVADLIFHQKK